MTFQNSAGAQDGQWRILPEQRRHILCNGKLPTEQREAARILDAKVQLLRFKVQLLLFLVRQAKSAHPSINLEQVLDAASKNVFPKIQILNWLARVEWIVEVLRAAAQIS